MEYNTSIHNITINHDLSIFVGSIYLCSSFLFIAISVICLLFMLTESTTRLSSFYQIAIGLELSDIVQLLANGVASVSLTFLENTRDYYWLNNILSATLGCGWMACVVQAHLLSFNRFIHVYWPERIKTIFSLNRTRIFVSCIWIFGFIWFIMLLQPIFNLLYSLKTYSFKYEKKKRASWLLMTVHMCVNVINMFGMVVWYSLIYWKVRNQVNSIQNIRLMKDRHKDRKTLFQAFMICSMVTISTLGFAICQYSQLPWWASFLTNIIWISAAGSNAVIHLAMNSTLRLRLVLFLKGHLWAKNNVQSLNISNDRSRLPGKAFTNQRADIEHFTMTGQVS